MLDEKPKVVTSEDPPNNLTSSYESIHRGHPGRSRTIKCRDTFILHAFRGGAVNSEFDILK